MNVPECDYLAEVGRLGPAKLPGAMDPQSLKKEMGLSCF